MYDFFDILDDYSKCQGNKRAITSEDDSVTFLEFYKMISFARQYLQNIDKTNIILKENNQFEFSLNFFALILSDKMIIPVRNDISQGELEQIMSEIDASLFEDNILERFRKFTEYTENTCYIPKMALKNAGIIHMTSGSTGLSKYCIRTLESLIYEAINFKTLYKVTPDDNILSLCPLNHSFSLGAALLTSVYSGSSLYTIKKFSPRKAVKQIVEDSITYLVMVPDMARLLCMTNNNYDERDFNIRIPLVGAGLTTKELCGDFKDKFYSKIRCNYGSTETGAIMSASGTTPVSSVGSPLNCVKVKLKDDHGNEILSEAAEGELFVKSEAMLSGYLNKELVLDKDGYFCMGDIVRRDERRNYFVVGRKKAIAKIAGVTVNLAEVENVIRQYPDVIDCIVYTKKINESKEVLLAMAAGKNLDSAVLRDFCKCKLSSACIPTTFFISEKLHKNELGKVKVKI